MSEIDNEAMAKAACNAIFSTQGEVESMCARYAYNMGYYFMNGQVKSPFVGAGNMGSESYYNGVQNLGYRLEINEDNLTKDELKKKIQNSTFPAGAIVCYKCNTQTPSSNGASSHYKYGHTQFYIGGDRTKGSSFPSSVRNNYGNVFVYSSRPGNSWQYKVFVPSGSSNVLYCEQEYVDTSDCPTNGGHEFYEPYNVNISESERNANGRAILQTLMSRAGLTKNEACAFAGCFWVESRWNPTAYSKHPKQHDFGLAQWTTPYGRQQKLYEMCDRDKTRFKSLNDQLDFVVFELQNKYTSPTNGGGFNYTGIIPRLKGLSAKGASLAELTWCVVCMYEAGGNWKDVPYSQTHYDNNDCHIKQRLEGAKMAQQL